MDYKVKKIRSSKFTLGLTFFFLRTITRHPINPYTLLSFSPPSFTSFTIPSFSLLVPVQPLSPSLIPRPFLQHTHTHCPFQSPSSSRSRSPSLKGRYYIFQSVLCMIWGVDEAISRSPPWPLPPFCFSPCCLMFQFGGSKHSIRQINCLMHVISQTVYKKGTLCLSPIHTHTYTPQHPHAAALPFSLPGLLRPMQTLSTLI